MNQNSQLLVRSIRGPIIMITIGVLFAVDRFTNYRFGQTWPVLLIVTGLMQLLGGRRRRAEYYPPPASPSSSAPPPFGSQSYPPGANYPPAPPRGDSGEPRS